MNGARISQYRTTEVRTILELPVQIELLSSEGQRSDGQAAKVYQKGLAAKLAIFGCAYGHSVCGRP